MRSFSELLNLCSFWGVELMLNDKDKSSIRCKVPKGFSIESIKEDIKYYELDILKMIVNNVQNNLLVQQNQKSHTSISSYMAQRMLELGLTREDVRGENNPTLALDEIELQEIRSDKQLFNTWVEHVHRHKQLKALELTKEQQAEEYALDDTLGSLPLEHQFKFIEHVLTTFKKFFFGDKYSGVQPTDLFVEMWFKANHDLTLGQIFNASAELIGLAKVAKDNGNDAEFKRLQGISENPEYFRRFYLDETQNVSNEVTH